jgi:tRNA pseudouridine55 synthase
MGRSARSPKAYRNLDGILILDKPAGISSNTALQDTRHIFKARKAGHSGSLDPLATGVLPICFGEATKFSSYLLDASKRYRASCKLGQTSTTGDAEGEIVRDLPVKVSRQQIQQVLETFTGDIEQIPPMHSALKHKGKRLYELARQGKQVDRKPRRLHIHTLELLSFDNECLVIDVHCSKGTYIRTLAQDIGEALGCGAYISALRRTGVEPFWGEDEYSIDQLRILAGQGMDKIDALLLPVSAALKEFPALLLDDSRCLQLQQGKVIRMEPAGGVGIHRLVSENGRFIGLGEAFPDGSLGAKRLMNTTR